MGSGQLKQDQTGSQMTPLKIPSGIALNGVREGLVPTGQVLPQAPKHCLDRSTNKPHSQEKEGESNKKQRGRI